VPGGDEVADVPGVDRVERVLFLGVGERDAERATAREGEVVGVAGMLFGIELGQ
jgi:hypothetical protein